MSDTGQIKAQDPDIWYETYTEDISQTKNGDVIRDIRQPHSEVYAEALVHYPTDEHIDKVAEAKLRRKLDYRILPLLGICYFFYYVDKTTLSYAAIFGIKTDLALNTQGYSWLSSLFYFGWLVWAIPSNLIMQRCPPGWCLAANIFMWGALLMVQAVAQNFASLAALRVFSGAFEAIADPAFMLLTSMYYTRSEQPIRIAIWYSFNGIGVAGGGLIGYGIGHIKGALQSWRYEFLIVGACCALWGVFLFILLPNSPATFHGFSHDERLMMIARMRQNQTGVEQRYINWGQVREAYLDYKTWLFCLLGFVGNVPNGVSNSRTLVGVIFMLPTIAGGLGFLLAPPDAYIGRLICFYLTGSYQTSFINTLSMVIGNTGGQSKKMIIAGMIWFGGCIGNIASPFFYKSDQAPRYGLGIGSLLVANFIELGLFLVFRYAFMWENKRKEKTREQMRQNGELEGLNQTAFKDLTDRENPNFEYIY
ncbi:transporter [Seiridium cupressi]